MIKQNKKDLGDIETTRNLYDWVKDRNICAYCGNTKGKMHEEHVIAKSKGGKSTIPACPICNQSKGNKALMKWLRFVKTTNNKHWIKIVKFNYRKRNPIAKKIHSIIKEQ